MVAMNPEPLLQAPLAVKLHVATIVPAFAIGTWLIFFSRKGSRRHRMLGAAYLGLMVATAMVSLFIHRRMPHSPVFGLSPTHLFVPFTLFWVYRALATVRRGNIQGHRTAMLGLYFGALVYNGLANVFLFPGITHDVFFGEHETSRIVMILLFLLFLGVAVFVAAKQFRKQWREAGDGRVNANAPR
jgi:uncharacterized membrane protein